MPASTSPGTAGNPPHSSSGTPKPSRWGLALTVASYTVLLLLGFAVGILGGIAAGWLHWLWLANGAAKVLAVGVLVVFLGVLFSGCRVAGWSMASRLGAGLPAIGWTASGVLLTLVTPAGDIVLTASGIDYAYLFGGLAVVSLATVLTEPS